MEDQKKQIISAIIPVLKNETVFALVYGSFLSEAFTEHSDIDLAVFPKKTVNTWDDKMLFYQKLEELPGHEYDIVFLNDCDLIIAMQIIANGRLFVNHDPGRFIQYKAGVISQYIDFKMSRKIIEENLLKGRIYA